MTIKRKIVFFIKKKKLKTNIALIYSFQFFDLAVTTTATPTPGNVSISFIKTDCFWQDVTDTKSFLYLFQTIK
jgi:hypothetical protein